MPTTECAKCKELEQIIGRLRAALGAVVKWADDLRYFSEEGSKLAPVFQQAKSALEREQKKAGNVPRGRSSTEGDDHDH